jgi:hypothetical protein
MGQSIVKKKDNEQVWRAHVEGADKHPRSVSAYCREKGISRFALNYWMRKLGQERRTKEVIQQFPIPGKAKAAFIPVSVLDAAQKKPGLPDPKWVAQVLMHLAGGGR